MMQRKVTTDLLEKLASSLPKANNPLGKTLRFPQSHVENLVWKTNLMYLEDWKRIKKDDATIGKLIQLLKSSGFKETDYECLFNINKQPRNVSTATDSAIDVDFSTCTSPGGENNIMPLTRQLMQSIIASPTYKHPQQQQLQHQQQQYMTSPHHDAVQQQNLMDGYG